MTIRLLETLTTIAGVTVDPEFREAARRHAELIQRGSQEGLPDSFDREEVSARYRTLLEALESPAELAAVTAEGCQ